MMMHSSACDCEASLCETLRGFSAKHPDSVIINIANERPAKRRLRG